MMFQAAMLPTFVVSFNSSNPLSKQFHYLLPILPVDVAEATTEFVEQRVRRIEGDDEWVDRGVSTPTADNLICQSRPAICESPPPCPPRGS